MELLKEISKRDSCIIDCFPIKIINQTIIKYKCNCGTEHNRDFRSIKEKGAFCTNCMKKNGILKKEETNLKKFGVKYPSQSKDIQEKTQETNLEKYGVNWSFQSDDVKEKIKETNLERYGVENPGQSEEIKEKIKAINLERYGVENAMQNDQVKEKLKATCLERYGVEYPTQNDEVKEKSKATCLERYGVEYSLQSCEVKEKSKATCLQRYGFEHAKQSEEVKEKAKATTLERYGVENPMQNEEIFEKCMKSSASRKIYTFSNGKQIKLQGYEPLAIDDIIKNGFEIDDIITSQKEIPKIWYINNNIKHRYYCDIFLKSINKLIEVKNPFGYKYNYEIIMLKAKACIKQGFNYEIWIYDQKGNKQVVKEFN